MKTFQFMVYSALFAITFSFAANAQVTALHTGATHQGAPGTETILILKAKVSAVEHYYFVSHLLTDETGKFDEIVGRRAGYLESELTGLPEILAKEEGQHISYPWAITSQVAMGVSLYGRQKSNIKLGEQVQKISQYNYELTQAMNQGLTVKNAQAIPNEMYFDYYQYLKPAYTGPGMKKGSNASFIYKLQEFRLSGKNIMNISSDIVAAETNIMRSENLAAKYAKNVKAWKAAIWVTGISLVTSLVAVGYSELAKNPIFTNQKLVDFVSLKQTRVPLENEAEVARFKTALAGALAKIK